MTIEIVEESVYACVCERERESVREVYRREVALPTLSCAVECFSCKRAERRQQTWFHLKVAALSLRK